MKNLSISLLIIILLSLNIFLLYTNVERQNQINSLTTYLFSGLDMTGKILTESALAHEVEGKMSDFTLLFYIPENSCESCVKFEVENLNKFHDEYEDYIQVFVITKNNNFLDEYGAQFSYKKIDPSTPILNNIDFNYNNPFALLSDRNGIIHNVYTSEVGNSKKSDRYFERMKSFIFHAFEIPNTTE